VKWFQKAWIGVKFSARYDIAYPIRGRIMVLTSRLLLAVGLAAVEKAIRAAIWFDSWIAGGIQKRAHQCGRSEDWSRRSADFVDEARALKVKLHGRELQPRLVPGVRRRGE
jgi:hypothetical protein